MTEVPSTSTPGSTVYSDAFTANRCSWQRFSRLTPGAGDRRRAHRTGADLHVVPESNRGIGMAMAVPTNLHDLTRADAFALLPVAGQNTPRTLRHIATTVADTGTSTPSDSRRRQVPRTEEDR